MNKEKEKHSTAKNKDASVGGEEFSEKMYDENAPVPEEFDNVHEVSSTGARLYETPSVCSNDGPRAASIQNDTASFNLE